MSNAAGFASTITAPEEVVVDVVMEVLSGEDVPSILMTVVAPAG